MRICEVIGTVTLNRCLPSFDGATLKMAVPYSLAQLTGDEEPGDEFIVAWDQLGAGIGSMIAVSEGPEGSMAFRPAIKPVDAYNAAILDTIDIE